MVAVIARKLSRSAWLQLSGWNFRITGCALRETKISVGIICCSIQPISYHFIKNVSWVPSIVAGISCRRCIIYTGQCLLLRVASNGYVLRDGIVCLCGGYRCKGKSSASATTRRKERTQLWRTLPVFCCRKYPQIFVLVQGLHLCQNFWGWLERALGVQSGSFSWRPVRKEVVTDLG